MRKKYLNIVISLALLIAAVFAVKGLFFKKTISANEIYILSQNYQTLSTEKHTYTFAGTAEFKNIQTDQKEIGETQSGDKVYEVKGDTSHKTVEVVLNKDNPPHLIYTMKS
ncbi:hypothetical protein LSG31_18210 [Fodinisporobacter ferrooxydans]|uniref:DUF1093 domain-containing protein n=1 Tax=Fodinisporobacter ferrooxydans TaxID=2901836 RepID=A0ABY4CGZ9_9BACL|nr:hypothetical protein LSG31_18210 [Alicyclobacillaceae bacterium MYW30-H2]